MQIEETTYLLDGSTKVRILPEVFKYVAPPLFKEFIKDNFVTAITVETKASEYFRAAKYTKIWS